MNSAYKKSVFDQAAKVAHLTYQIGELNLLREKSESVKDISFQKTKTTVSKLKETLKQYRKLSGKGRGVAAVQIGIPLKIAVIFSGKEILTIINPEIIERSDKLFSYPEICMSANPIVAQVTRPEWVKVSYLDESGNKKIWNKKSRILNRVIQHEIDHMNGIINIDLVNSRDLFLDSDPTFFEKAKFKEIK